METIDLRDLTNWKSPDGQCHEFMVIASDPYFSFYANFNGVKRKFLIDTGSPTGLIPKKWLEGIEKEKLSNKEIRFSMDIIPVDGSYYTLKNAKFDGLELTDLVVFSPNQNILAEAFPEEVGILGLNTFYNYALEYVAKNSSIKFYRLGSSSIQVNRTEPINNSEYLKVSTPVKLYQDNLIFSSNLVLDTGYPGEFLVPQQSIENSNQSVKEQQYYFLGSDLSSKSIFYFHRFRYVDFHLNEVIKVQNCLLELHDKYFTAVGFGFLRNSDFALNLKDKALYLNIQTYRKFSSFPDIIVKKKEPHLEEDNLYILNGVKKEYFSRFMSLLGSVVTIMPILSYENTARTEYNLNRYTLFTQNDLNIQSPLWLSLRTKTGALSWEEPIIIHGNE